MIWPHYTALESMAKRLAVMSPWVTMNGQPNRTKEKKRVGERNKKRENWYPDIMAFENYYIRNCTWQCEAIESVRLVF